MRVDSRLWPVVWHGRGQAKSDRIDTESQPSPTIQDSEPCSRVAHGIEEASSLIAPSLPEEYSPDYRSTQCTHCAALSWRRDANFSVFLDGADHNGSKPASLPTPFSATLHLAEDKFACVPIVSPHCFPLRCLLLHHLRHWCQVAKRSLAASCCLATPARYLIWSHRNELIFVPGLFRKANPCLYKSLGYKTERLIKSNRGRVSQVHG